MLQGGGPWDGIVFNVPIVPAEIRVRLFENDVAEGTLDIDAIKSHVYVIAEESDGSSESQAVFQYWTGEKSPFDH
jgi:hypothetical protein